MDLTGKAAVHYRLIRADNTLRSVRLMATNQSWDSAISLLYYAAFQAVAASLSQLTITIKSHVGAKRLFQKHFVKTGLVNAQDGKFYSRLYEARDKSDHKDFAVFTAEDVLPLLPQTEEFIDVIKRLIDKN